MSTINYKDGKLLSSDEALIFKDQNSVQSPLFHLKSYIFSRYSSQDRIKINTTLVTVGGTLFGIGQSIFKNLPRFKTGITFFAGSSLLGFSYLVININLFNTHFWQFDYNKTMLKLAFNEIFNGWVKRQMNKEQFFISNSLSMITNMILFYGVQNGFRGVSSNIALPQAGKYLLSLCIVSMLFDIQIIVKRDIYLQRTQQHLQFGITKRESTETYEQLKQQKTQEYNEKELQLQKEWADKNKKQIENKFNQ